MKGFEIDVKMVFDRPRYPSDMILTLKWRTVLETNYTNFRELVLSGYLSLTMYKSLN